MVKITPRALKIGVQSHFHPISTMGFRTFFRENFGLAYVMCNGAEENQVEHCDSDGPRVQEQLLFLVSSIIDIFTHIRTESHISYCGADQK